MINGMSEDVDGAWSCILLPLGCSVEEFSKSVSNNLLR